jgi:L-fucose mutarotase
LEADVVLLGVHPLLRGPLLAALDGMGHGDVLVVADAEFPARRLCGSVIDMPGVAAPAALAALCTVFPLDDAEPLWFMTAPQGWLPVQEELLGATGRPASAVRTAERHAFYDLASAARVVVSTGERRPYGNLLLRKGVVDDSRPGAAGGPLDQDQ